MFRLVTNQQKPRHQHQSCTENRKPGGNYVSIIVHLMLAASIRTQDSRVPDSIEVKLRRDCSKDAPKGTSRRFRGSAPCPGSVTPALNRKGRNTKPQHELSHPTLSKTGGSMSDIQSVLKMQRCSNSSSTNCGTRACLSPSRQMAQSSAPIRTGRRSIPWRTRFETAAFRGTCRG